MWPHRQQTLIVHETDEYESTGLFNKDGEKLERRTHKHPMGFIWTWPSEETPDADVR